MHAYLTEREIGILLSAVSDALYWEEEARSVGEGSRATWKNYKEMQSMLHEYADHIALQHEAADELAEVTA